MILELKDKHYIKDTLSIGNNKFLGFVKLNDNPVRRLDILITNKEEMLLHFTGDKYVNIKLRREAIKQKLKLNEKALIDISNKNIKLKSEREIFHYLGFKYISPKKRKASDLVYL